MPGFNTLTPRYTPFGNRLEAMRRWHNTNRGRVVAGTAFGAGAVTGAVYGKVINSKNKISPTNTMVKTKKQAKRMTRRTRRYARVPRTVQPKSCIRAFKTCTYGALNPGAGAISVTKQNLNSCFDPTGEAGSGQPLGWDQMTALYNKYCVVAWSVKFEWVSTDNTNALIVGFTPTTSSTALTNYAHYKELPGTVSAIITPDIDRGRLFSKGGVKKWFMPRGGKILSNENLTSSTGGSPTNILYGHMFAQSIDGSADPATVNFIMTVYQKVVFFDPVIPSRS